MEKLRNYVNGKYIEPLSNQYIDNFEPATGKVYSLIPNSNEEDVNQAVEAADLAFPIWSSMSV